MILISGIMMVTCIIPIELPKANFYNFGSNFQNMNTYLFEMLKIKPEKMWSMRALERKRESKN